jgi:hypothetical protein
MHQQVDTSSGCFVVKAYCKIKEQSVDWHSQKNKKDFKENEHCQLVLTNEDV